MYERKRLLLELQEIEKEIFPDPDDLDINTATPEQVKRIEQINRRAETELDKMGKRGTGPFNKSEAWQDWMQVEVDSRCNLGHINGTI